MIFKVLEMSRLEIFPVEVMEMVYSHLTGAEILESTLTSPRVNKIIGNSIQLMRNIRFGIEGKRNAPGTRKYSQIDFYELNLQSTFDDLPVHLTQLTFEHCNMEGDIFHALLSKVSQTLELLIVHNCKLFKDSVEYERRGLFVLTIDWQSVNFVKLKTLILVDMEGTSKFVLLSIIGAMNLVELGVVEIEGCDPEGVDIFCATKFVDIIKCNPNLKSLHIPLLATDSFLNYTIENPEVEFRFEELGFRVTPYEESIDNKAMNFVESQKNTLKRLNFDCYSFREEGEYISRLLSLNLECLEIRLCWIRPSWNWNVQNTTIESLAIIGSVHGMHEPIRKIVKCCSNLTECAVFVVQDPPSLFPSKSWKFHDNNKILPEKVCWSDLRSLRFAGVAQGIVFFHNFLNERRYHFYYDESKEVSKKKHPYSIIKFKPHALE